MENNYYVYAHLTPIERSVFYIGIGKNDRVIDGARFRNKKWKSKIYELGGYLFEFLHKNITKEEALKLERKYILYYGLENLTNIVGEGGNSTAFKKGQTPWNKGLKCCQVHITKKVSYNGTIFESVTECIEKLNIGKTTFYRWVKKNKISYV